jgi:hypothetical protein
MSKYVSFYDVLQYDFAYIQNRITLKLHSKLLTSFVDYKIRDNVIFIHFNWNKLIYYLKKIYILGNIYDIIFEYITLDDIV